MIITALHAIKPNLLGLDSWRVQRGGSAAVISYNVGTVGQ